MSDDRPVPSNDDIPEDGSVPLASSSGFVLKRMPGVACGLIGLAILQMAVGTAIQGADKLDADWSTWVAAGQGILFGAILFQPTSSPFRLLLGLCCAAGCLLGWMIVPVISEHGGEPLAIVWASTAAGYGGVALLLFQSLKDDNSLTDPAGRQDAPERTDDAPVREGRQPGTLVPVTCPACGAANVPDEYGRCPACLGRIL